MRASLSLEHLVFCFCFWSSTPIFYRPLAVVRLLEYILYLKEKREGETSLVKEKDFGKEEGNSYM
jgi:hypothetical protein